MYLQESTSEGVLDVSCEHQAQGFQEVIEGIAELFPGEVPVPPTPASKARIEDLSGVLRNPVTPRRTLPLFPALRKALSKVESEISAGDNPLPVGKFSSSMRLPATMKEALELADASTFLRDAPRDARLSELFNIREDKKNALVDRHLLRAWEEDLRASIASLSVAMWSLHASKELLSSREIEFRSQRLEDLHTLRGAALTSQAERLVNVYSSVLLFRRDLVLSLLPKLPTEDVLILRSSSLISATMFGGQLPAVAQRQEAAKHGLVVGDGFKLLSDVLKKVIVN